MAGLRSLLRRTIEMVQNSNCYFQGRDALGTIELLLPGQGCPGDHKTATARAGMPWGPYDQGRDALGTI